MDAILELRLSISFALWYQKEGANAFKKWKAGRKISEEKAFRQWFYGPGGNLFYKKVKNGDTKVC